MLSRARYPTSRYAFRGTDLQTKPLHFCVAEAIQSRRDFRYRTDLLLLMRHPSPPEIRWNRPGKVSILSKPLWLSHCIANLNADPDPYNYTSGRWLHQDALQRTSRNIQFDFDALCCRIIALCPGASSITSYDKKEGGYNRVFIFNTDNARRVVARLPFPMAGPRRLLTNSEVATIKFCKW